MRSNDGQKNFKPMAEVRIPGKPGAFAHRLAHVRPSVWLVLAFAGLAAAVFLLPSHFWKILWKGVAAQKFLVGMLAVFSLVLLSFIWSSGQQIDEWVFRLINRRGRRSHGLDRVMLCVTQLGNGMFAYATALVLLITNHRLLAYELIFGNITLWMAVELMKVLMRRERPYSFLKDIRILGRRERGHSFPSGHTSQAFFMASLLSHYFRTALPITVLLYILALSVGITRIYVGMHYPRDVLGGIILGTSWGLIGVFINSYLFLKLSL